MYKLFFQKFIKTKKENILRNFALYKRNKIRGFLLIELLIAMTVFSITIAIATGTFINVLHTQKQVIALANTQSNISIAIEQMTREIRTGNNFCVNSSQGCDPKFNCQYNTSDNVENCVGIEFTNANGEDIKYYINNGFLEKSVNGTVEDLTSSDVSVKYLSFNFFGNTNSSKWNPPRITIAIGVYPNNSALKGNVLNLETTVSQRQ